MVTEQQPSPSFQRVLQALQSQPLLVKGKKRPPSAVDPSILPLYQGLSAAEKATIVSEMRLFVKDLFQQGADFKTTLELFLTLFGNTEDWHHVQTFLKSVSETAVDTRFIEAICHKALSILDEESILLEKNLPAKPLKEGWSLVASSLALITELACTLKRNQPYQTKEGKRYTLHCLDHLASHLLARSHINHKVVHVGLLYFFANLEGYSSLHLQKILERFGEGLLEGILNNYFGPKQNNADKNTLFCIFGYLDTFLFSSAHVAEMASHVLKRYMLKHPKEFVTFIDDFLATRQAQKERCAPETIRPLVVHFAFLLRDACEFQQDNLAHQLLRQIGHVFSSTNAPLQARFYAECLQDMKSIISESNTKIAHFICQRITGESVDNLFSQKLVVKKAKSENTASSIDQILFLAG